MVTRRRLLATLLVAGFGVLIALGWTLSMRGAIEGTVYAGGGCPGNPPQECAWLWLQRSSRGCRRDGSDFLLGGLGCFGPDRPQRTLLARPSSRHLHGGGVEIEMGGSLVQRHTFSPSNHGNPVLAGANLGRPD